MRVELREGAAWYEFRHDYLVRQVASWVNREEERVSRRRLIMATLLAAVPALVWGATATIDFNRYVVSLEADDRNQMREIVVRRGWNPVGFRIGTGLFEDDLRDARVVAKLTSVSGPFELPIGRVITAKRFGRIARWTASRRFICRTAL